MALVGMFMGLTTLAYYAFAQTNQTVPINGPNGTTIYVAQTGNTGGDAVLKMLGVVGSIIGAIALILQRLPWKWSKDVSKFAGTFGQKVVDSTGDVAIAMMAMNAYTKGELENFLKPYGMTINDYADRFNTGNKQLQYLNPQKYLPSFPDYDAEMPRELTAPNHRKEGINRAPI